MTTANPDPRDETEAFDYLRVDEFIKNIVEARALGTAFELGIIDYLIENQGCTPDKLKQAFQLEEKGLGQISDSGAIEEIVAKVLAGHSDEVSAYKGGKTKLMGFFVGQVMQATRGQANPKLVNEILKKKLAG